jgi:UPF0716 family protein affecting phage T7 exclusion
VLIALIAAGPGMVTSVIGAVSLVKVRRIRQDTAATRDQVENNHDTNLREEADSRHEENKSTLGRLERGFSAFRREVREEFKALRGDDRDQRDRIHDLEKTIDKAPKGTDHE